MAEKESGWTKFAERKPSYGKLVYTKDVKGTIGVYTRYYNRHVGDVYSSRISTDNNAVTEWLDEACSDPRCDDTNRLEVLMRHPDKLFIDESSGERLYSGINGVWHDDPRKAVDDIVGQVTTR